LIAEAGSVAIEEVLPRNKSIRRIIWVTKAGNTHLDWNEVPAEFNGNVDIATWHEIIDAKKASASNEVPPLDKDNEPMPIYSLTSAAAGRYELFEYTSKVLSVRYVHVTYD